MENFEDATKEIFEAISGDSNTDYEEEMEPVAAIPADIHGFFFRTVMFVSAYYY